MADKSSKDKPKPGPDPEVLIIEEDPGDALRRLLKVPPCPPEQPEPESDSED